MSAFVGDGQADVVLALEPLEALRARPQMSAETTVVVSRATIVPFPLAQRGESYPPVDGIMDQLHVVSMKCLFVRRRWQHRAQNLTNAGLLALRQVFRGDA